MEIENDRCLLTATTTHTTTAFTVGSQIDISVVFGHVFHNKRCNYPKKNRYSQKLRYKKC